MDGGPKTHQTIVLMFGLNFRDLVDEAKDYHLMPERRPHLPAFKTRPRCCTSIAGLIYAVGGLNSAGTLHIHFPQLPSDEYIE